MRWVHLARLTALPLLGNDDTSLSLRTSHNAVQDIRYCMSNNCMKWERWSTYVHSSESNYYHVVLSVGYSFTYCFLPDSSACFMLASSLINRFFVPTWSYHFQLLCLPGLQSAIHRSVLCFVEKSILFSTALCPLRNGVPFFVYREQSVSYFQTLRSVNVCQVDARIAICYNFV